MKTTAICVKAVPYQEIIDLRDTLERLQSWHEPLQVLDKYFRNTGVPLNKKQVVREYYACSQLFLLFKMDYELLMERAEKQLFTVNNRRKITFLESSMK